LSEFNINVMGKRVAVEEGTTFGEVAKAFENCFDSPILLAQQGQRLRELGHTVCSDEAITFQDLTNEDGMRVYQRGVSFLLAKAVHDLYGAEALVAIEHSLGGSLYCELREPKKEITVGLIGEIEAKMRSYVEADLPIVKHVFRKEMARQIVRDQKMRDKVELFRYRRASNINLYEMDGFYDYFYGYMPLSAKALSLFLLMPYENGFFMQLPDPKNPKVVLPFKDVKNIHRVFMEQMSWCKLMGVSNVAELNHSIVEGRFGELIRINEALHEKKIAEIADQVHDHIDKVKVILIAGPSSSGKTSFANRLCVQLSVLGIRPHKVSLDDYFINRDNTPLDEEGNPDLESIYALDLPRLNHDLKLLIDNQRVEIPRYDFVAGQREAKGVFLQLDADEILVLEGIHGLNDKLTENIPLENKFRIFISALTQLNIDDHNRISTSDSRLIRRMVRDHQFRGRDAATTIATWNAVTRGEAANIFPYQGNADAIFNSATIYELSVLKQYAEPLLFHIEEGQPEYITAKRLIKFLGYFLAAPGLEIPNNSLIKEFVGGSCFKV